MSCVTRCTAAALIAISIVLSPSINAQSTATTSAGSPGSTRDTVKAALVRQLLIRTQAADQAIAVMEASLPAQRQSNPRIPAVFWDRFLAQARASRGELIDMMAVVYERHFTTEEVRQLLQFFDTPIGRKLVTVQPTIAQESVLAGQLWGQRVGEAIGKQLAAEGVVITP